MLPFNTEDNKGKAQRRYTQLEQVRDPFLRRARSCAELSIPHILQEQKNDDLHITYQSVTARGVNNLASRLMMALLPPNAPFFKLSIDTSKLTPEEKADTKMKTELDRGLSKVERAVIEEIASTSDRTTLFEALKNIIICGNALLHLLPEGGMKCHRLDTYVVVRDGEGKVKEIVIKEEIHEDDVPHFVFQHQEQSDKVKTDKKYDIYTHIERKQNKKWEVYQEILGVVLPESKGIYIGETCPWIAIRMYSVTGEDYGRSYVEEYFGDINSLDALSQASLEGCTALAKILFMVAPNSTTKVQDLASASNLGFVVGKREDVQTLQVDKIGDLRMAGENAKEIERRLEHAFLLNSAVQRNGERVTAEEIRRMVDDLETALGGVYSLLAQEFQLPYISCRLAQLTKRKRIPELPKKLVKPVITTGVEALGRGHDQDKLNMFVRTLVEVLGQEAMKYLEPTTLITRLATAMGIDTEGLIVSQEAIQAQAQEQQMQQQMQMLTPEVGKMAQEFTKQDPEAMMQALGGLDMGALQQQQGGQIQ